MVEAGYDAVVAARLASQMLAGPPGTSVEGVVGRLLAVQAQDGRGARLSVRSRSTGLEATDVDQALSRDRSLVITWLNRGTLHLVRTEDYWWLHQLTGSRLAPGSERRLRQLGVAPAQTARGVDVIIRTLTDEGPQSRHQLRQRLHSAGVAADGQALVHILVVASSTGAVVRGPMVGGHQAFVAVPDWAGPAPKALDSEEALARLARRYLVGHAPAGPTDLAKWAGVALGDARKGFAAIADEVVPAAPGLVALTVSTPPALPPPRLLGPFDPLLHGWASRRPFVGQHGSVVTVNGIFRPVALVGGRAVATWGLPGGRVTITPLEVVPARARRALERDGADVLRFLALPDTPVVFR
ncbi:MAG: winged helix DNA-binding domain-containing protein [Acidimicrobiales bacterium]